MTHYLSSSDSVSLHPHGPRCRPYSGLRRRPWQALRCLLIRASSAPVVQTRAAPEVSPPGAHHHLLLFQVVTTATASCHLRPCVFQANQPWKLLLLQLLPPGWHTSAARPMWTQHPQPQLLKHSRLRSEEVRCHLRKCRSGTNFCKYMYIFHFRVSDAMNLNPEFVFQYRNQEIYHSIFWPPRLEFMSTKFFFPFHFW